MGVGERVDPAEAADGSGEWASCVQGDLVEGTCGRRVGIDDVGSMREFSFRARLAWDGEGSIFGAWLGL